MIQLRSDCLVFELANGEAFPCSAECVTVELIGAAADLLDPEVVQQAAAAVLHYFRNELGRTQVSVGEFSEALETVLRGLGLTVKSVEERGDAPTVAETDLRQLACESGKGYELLFFSRLRQELQQQLSSAPNIVRFRGLRGCVKQLVGAKHWSGRCQQLSDQIVDYLRMCWSGQPGADHSALVVQ